MRQCRMPECGNAEGRSSKADGRMTKADWRSLTYDVRPVTSRAARYQRSRRRPARVVLAVEGQLAVAVAPAGHGGGRRAGSSAQMRDGDVRGIQDVMPRGAQGRAEVHVLAVHEIALVEQPDLLGGRPAHEQAGAAHPVHELLPGHVGLDAVAHRRLVRRSAAGHAASGAFRSAARSSGRTTAPAGRRSSIRRGPAAAAPGSRSSATTQRLELSGRDQRVAVEEQHQRTVGRADADVVGGGKADVLGQPHQAHVWPPRRHGIRRCRLRTGCRRPPDPTAGPADCRAPTRGRPGRRLARCRSRPRWTPWPRSRASLPGGHERVPRRRRRVVPTVATDGGVTGGDLAGAPRRIAQQLDERGRYRVRVASRHVARAHRHRPRGPQACRGRRSAAGDASLRAA